VLVRFGLCPDIARDTELALTSEPETSALLLRRKIAVLRSHVAHLGYGVFQSSEAQVEFLSALPDVEASRWEELLLRRKRARIAGGVASCVCGYNDLGSMRTEWTPHTDVVVCATTHAVLAFGLGPEIHPKTTDGLSPEVLGTAAVDSIDAVDAARGIAATRVKGTLRDDVWKERLLTPATGARQLTILDSYIAHAAQRRIGMGFRDTRDEPLTGASWLLRKAGKVSDERGLVVEIFTRLRSPEHTLEDLLGSLRRMFHVDLLATLKRVRVLDVGPAPGGSPNAWTHQRIVQFDSVPIRLGNGTALFEDRRVAVDECCNIYEQDTDDLFRTLDSQKLRTLEWPGLTRATWTLAEWRPQTHGVSRELDVLGRDGQPG
jgi:hypothetical protein